MSRYYLDDADVDDQPAAVRGVRGRGPAHDRRAAAGAGAHLRAEVLATRSTCWTPAARSRRRSVPGRSRGCAPWRVRSRSCGRNAESRAGPPAGRRRSRRPPPLPAEAPDDRRHRRHCCSRSASRRCRPPRSTQHRGRVREALTAKLAATRLAHGAIHVPRDAATHRDASSTTWPPREPDAERTVRGPRVTAAYDGRRERRPRPRQGFARGQGVDVTDLVRVDVDGSSTWVRTDPGRGAADVLGGPAGVGRRGAACGQEHEVERPCAVVHPSGALARGAARRDRGADRGVVTGQRPDHPRAPDGAGAGRGRAVRARLRRVPGGTRHRGRRRRPQGVGS